MNMQSPAAPVPVSTVAASSSEIHDYSLRSNADLLRELETSANGLSAREAARRLKSNGRNLVTHSSRNMLLELLSQFAKPLVLLLLGLAGLSQLLGDPHSALMIAAVVVLSVVLAFSQEHRSTRAAEKLSAMVHTRATVRRRSDEDSAPGSWLELPIEDLVPGDIVKLSAGDIIPADLRLLTAKDLFVNQSVLTGEAMPVEKSAEAVDANRDSPFELSNICFAGCSVVSGYSEGLVLRTGARSSFGQIAEAVMTTGEPTAFDIGMGRYTKLMLGFMAVMVPLVFLINGIGKGDWLQALLFAVAVAVGLTPEMLPMIVTVNLAKGALAMSRKHVIVKRLASIQNFGAMDILCTDKTGTLTQDRIILKLYLDIYGADSKRVLGYAYLNSWFQSGLKNLLDRAVLDHEDRAGKSSIELGYRKIDEVPFDFNRRRLSVVLQGTDGKQLLICKGAVDEVFAACSRFETASESGLLDDSHFAVVEEQIARLNDDGFRVVAVAYKKVEGDQPAYTAEDERDLILLGYIAFLDPPKESAGPAIAALQAHGVVVKILTGDSERVAGKVCRDVGLVFDRVVKGNETEGLTPAALIELAESQTVFAKLSPTQKAAIIQALRARHVVGFLGDGINDGPALKAADVGISVDTAVDIAKESADIILLEKSLSVLVDGVIEGRKVFANIIKYIRMGASSNFGNMLSMLGASLFLPFLPLAPLQILTNNLLYDFSQTAIPTDSVDQEYLTRPRKWDIGNIAHFMLFMGPVSSLFDYVTFGILLYGFDAWTRPSLFQSGWFVESLLTQTLIVHILRTGKRPIFESRASRSLTATTLLVAVIGIVLPTSWFAKRLGFVPLPFGFWCALPIILLMYAIFAQWVKSRVIRRWGM